MSQKLREFISAVRACKSTADEAALVARECAAIRTACRDEQSPYRHRNIAKLLFIDMMGYNVSFGQLDCLKLIASNQFLEKRIGYMALPSLLDQRSDILMLATNTMKNDIVSGTQYIAGAALVALGNVGTPEMIETLAKEIFEIINGTNPMLKKKAIILCAKLVENSKDIALKYAPKVPLLLADRNHSVLMSTLTLLNTLLNVLPEIEAEVKPYIIDSLAPLVKYIRELIAGSPALAGSNGTGSTPQSSSFGLRAGLAASLEYDFYGVSDPFLQTSLLQYFGNLITKFDLDDFPPDSIAALIETIQTILIPQSGYRYSALTVVTEAMKTGLILYGKNRSYSHRDDSKSSNLLGLILNWLDQLLQQNDSTVKFIGIAMLSDYASAYMESLSKYSSTILDCLKLNDILLQRRAINLVALMMTQENAVELITELLNFLLILTDPLPTAMIDNLPSGKDVSFTSPSRVVVAQNHGGRSNTYKMSEEKSELCAYLIDIIIKCVNDHAPTKSWQIDFVIRLCCLVGNIFTAEAKTSIIRILTGTPELYDKVLSQLASSLKENLYQVTMAEICVWLFGELVGSPKNIEMPHHAVGADSRVDKISELDDDVSAEKDLLELIDSSQKNETDNLAQTCSIEEDSGDSVTHHPTVNLSFDESVSIEIIRILMDVYGLRSAETQCQRSALDLIQNTNQSGCLGPIGGSCIKSFPSPERHDLRREIYQQDPQSTLPYATIKALQNSNLSNLLTTALVRIAAKCPKLKTEAEQLLHSLSSQCHTMELQLRSDEYELMLSKPAIAKRILESRLFIPSIVNDRPIGRTSDKVVWISREDLDKNVKEHLSKIGVVNTMKATDLLSDELLIEQSGEELTDRKSDHQRKDLLDDLL